MAAAEDLPGGPSARRAPRIRFVSPNPTPGRAAVGCESGPGGHARLELCDAAGRVLATLPLGPSRPGLQRVDWDARSTAGARIGPGVYFLRLRGARGDSDAARLLIVR
jgi:hypothetical protein